MNAASAVAYLRTSTRDQALGLEAQRAAIEAWAAREGVSVVAWCEDKISGTTALDKRPGLLSALSAVKEHGADVLILQKRDRLARDTVEAGLIERAVRKLGATVATTDGTNDAASPTTALVNGILDSVAQFEGAQIRMRIRAALNAKRSKGEKLGGRAPYGFRVAADGVHLEHNPTEQTVIATVRELSAAGYSSRCLARELDRRGVVGRTGKPLSHVQVHRILAA
jgi:DNA invertase Pin-like site-specific DNA recombinase